MPLHSCMRLAIPCCGEARLHRLGPWQWHLNCVLFSCFALVMRVQQIDSGTMLVHSCMFLHHHVVARRGCIDMDHDIERRRAACPVQVHRLRCRQILLQINASTMLVHSSMLLDHHAMVRWGCISKDHDNGRRRGGMHRVQLSVS